MLSTSWYVVRRFGKRYSHHSGEYEAIRAARQSHEAEDTALWTVHAPDGRLILELAALRPPTKMQKHAMWIIDIKFEGGPVDVGDHTSEVLGVIHHRTADALVARGGYQLSFNTTRGGSQISKVPS